MAGDVQGKASIKSLSGNLFLCMLLRDFGGVEDMPDVGLVVFTTGSDTGRRSAPATAANYFVLLVADFHTHSHNHGPAAGQSDPAIPCIPGASYPGGDQKHPLQCRHLCLLGCSHPLDSRCCVFHCHASLASMHFLQDSCRTWSLCVFAQLHLHGNTCRVANT